MRSILQFVAIATLTIAPFAPVQAAVERPGKWIEANGVMLRYELTGRGGETIVLLHDMGLSLEMWDELMPTIQHGRQVLRYDLRGFGLSEKFRGTITHEDYVADLTALLDRLKITKPVTLVGESLGGALAMKFAAMHPDRVRAVVAINPVIQLRNPPPIANPGLATGRDTPKLFETEGVRAYLKSDAEWLYPARLRTTERFDRYMGIETAQDPNSRAAVMRMKPFGLAEDEVRKVAAPTLLVAGMINNSLPIEGWRVIASEMPRARLEAIQSSHHAAYISPEIVGPVLRRFLDAPR